MNKLKNFITFLEKMAPTLAIHKIAKKDETYLSNIRDDLQWLQEQRRKYAEESERSDSIKSRLGESRSSGGNGEPYTTRKLSGSS